MKKALFVFLFLFLIFNSEFIIHPVSAHTAGQQPFFKINGTYSNLYPIQSNSYINDFVLPQDQAPEHYLVHTPITFEIDRTQLLTMMVEQTIQLTKFQWDFGDGTKGGTGLKNTHTYTKEGSYILTISISYENSTDAPQLFQSVLLHVLPNNSYQLPQPVIRVNTIDATKDVIDVDFLNKMIFDASGSKASSPIISYQWDFDDGEMGKGAVVSHTYSSRFFASPILRIKDANGFIVDTGIGLNQNEKQFFVKPAGIAIILAVVLTLAGGFFMLKRRRTTP